MNIGCFGGDVKMVMKSKSLQEQAEEFFIPGKLYKTKYSDSMIFMFLELRESGRKVIGYFYWVYWRETGNYHTHHYGGAVIPCDFKNIWKKAI